VGKDFGKDDMKLYVFVHSHLSTMQKGIQAAHAVAEILLKDKKARKWAKEHKTLIIVEGGNTQRMDSLLSHLQGSGISYAPFYEDNDTLDGLHTATAVLVDGAVTGNTEWHMVQAIIRTAPLAR